MTGNWSLVMQHYRGVPDIELARDLKASLMRGLFVSYQRHLSTSYQLPITSYRLRSLYVR